LERFGVGDFFENVTIALQFLERRPGNVFHRFYGSFEIAGQAAPGFFIERRETQRS
jgi:hypothetical protein